MIYFHDVTFVFSCWYVHQTQNVCGCIRVLYRKWWWLLPTATC